MATYGKDGKRCCLTQGQNALSVNAPVALVGLTQRRSYPVIWEFTLSPTGENPRSQGTTIPLIQCHQRSSNGVSRLRLYWGQRAADLLGRARWPQLEIVGPRVQEKGRQEVRQVGGHHDHEQPAKRLPDHRQRRRTGEVTTPITGQEDIDVYEQHCTLCRGLGMGSLPLC
jgi:hypothetical protein